MNQTADADWSGYELCPNKKCSAPADRPCVNTRVKYKLLMMVYPHRGRHRTLNVERAVARRKATMDRKQNLGLR